MSMYEHEGTNSDARTRQAIRRASRATGNYVAYYAEAIGGGRAIMRRDVVVDGELVESSTDGSLRPRSRQSRRTSG